MSLLCRSRILTCRSPPKCAPSKSRSPAVPRCWSRPGGRCPKPGPGEVLIQVAAAGVNRPDVLQRQGGYPPPPGASDLPGLEVAGEIVALGAGVAGAGRSATRSAPWSPAAAMPSTAPCPAPQCLPMPGPARHGRGGGAAGDLLHGLDQRLRPRPADRPARRFLVHGGSSGIGTTAIQLATAFGATVFATAGSAEKCAACERARAPSAPSTTATEDFVAGDQATRPAAGRRRDPRHGRRRLRRPQPRDAWRVEGRLVQIAFLQGAKVELNLSPV